MSSGIILVIKGELWDTNVEVHLAHTDAYDQGAILVKGKQPLNMSDKIRQLMGITETPASPDDWIIKPEAKVYMTKPKDTKGFIVGTQFGDVRFEYVSGSLQTGETGNALYLKTGIAAILSAIPGFQKEWISGDIELGIASGKAFRSFDNSGKLSFETVEPGLQLNASVEIAGTKVQLLPTKNNTPTVTDTKTPDAQKEKQEIEFSRKLGPVQLNKVKYNLSKEKLIVMLDAALTLGPLTLDFIDLGTEINLQTLMKDPLHAFTFRLYGLGINMNKDPLQIAGLLVKNPSKEEYSGGLLIKTKAFALTAFGVYSKEEDYHSLFGFLCLNANIGGDPAFFVTGISICFGYNREIIVPPIEKLAEFPLVRYAMDTGSAPALSKPGENPIVVFNRNMGGYIPPKKGAFFFGIGIKFNTYKVMDTVALLILAVSEDLEFHLLGLSRIALPAGQSVHPVVFIEIAMRASYSVNKGLLQIEGQLTSQSYLFSRDAKLMGGFAFYAWFKNQGNARAGDFVLTAGGYHPNFRKPSHYPNVPRIGFEWRIGSELFVSGKMYTALTPAAIMAGAAFQAVWKSGCLSAMFSFVADFLIQWKPFSYDAHINVTIQASFTVKVWVVSKSFTLDIGADLHIWGPEFSGTAELHARVLGIGVSFTIAFGGASQQVKLISWKDFKESFLPANALAANTQATGDIITITAAGGLLGEVEDQTQKNKVLLINPKEFALSVSSLLPVTGFTPALPGCIALSNAFCLPATGHNNVQSQLIIEFKDEKGIDCSDFLFTATSQNIPRALWNDAVQTNPLSPDQTIAMTTGLHITPKKQTETPVQEVYLTNFTYSPINVPISRDMRGSKTSSYADFFIPGTEYKAEDFCQVTEKDVMEYQEYYGDQSAKTELKNKN